MPISKNTIGLLQKALYGYRGWTAKGIHSRLAAGIKNRQEPERIWNAGFLITISI